MRRADNDLTPAEWRLIVGAWGGCAYCGAQESALQRDCVLPLARGGRYTISNVVPACRTCNTSKWHSEVTSWMRRRGLDEPAFLLRWHDITARLVASDDPEPPR
ncbi:HNH endonuclease [Lysobacter korlensis]|uniref:HNH endonuclease n=1 Tax=Lysobacter korlensis TaxID=553636 RepID=A0ABV6RRG7_9GAMM